MVQKILDGKEAYFFAFTSNNCIIVVTVMNNVKRNIVLDQEKSKEFINSIHQ